jgi:hypothetical protein
MIDVKQAVRSAMEFARELFGEQELRHLRVEEVELSEDERTWNITLGWVEPAIREKYALVQGTDEGVQKLPRVYKLFTVDAERGTVRGTKIRYVA